MPVAYYLIHKVKITRGFKKNNMHRTFSRMSSSLNNIFAFANLRKQLQRTSTIAPMAFDFLYARAGDTSRRNLRKNMYYFHYDLTSYLPINEILSVG